MLLLISCSMLNDSYYCYSPKKVASKIEGMTPEELDSKILGCSLKCISMLDSFNTFLDVIFSAYSRHQPEDTLRSASFFSLKHFSKNYRKKYTSERKMILAKS
jgi:hypothetical protein